MVPLPAADRLLNEFERAIRCLEDPRVVLPVVHVLTTHAPLSWGASDQARCLECEIEWPCKPVLDLAMHLKIRTKEM